MLFHPAHYQFSIINYQLRLLCSIHILRLRSRRGCVTATPLLLLLFYPDCFGIKFRRWRNRTKRGGLCSYWFNFEQGDVLNGQLSMVNCEWAIILPPPKNNRVLNHHIINYPFFSYQLLFYTLLKIIIFVCLLINVFSMPQRNHIYN
jgi:hypothetical protein